MPPELPKEVGIAGGVPAMPGPTEQITFEQAQKLPRNQRRALAKANGIAKIPGINNAIINPDKQLKRWKEKQNKIDDEKFNSKGSNIR